MAKRFANNSSSDSEDELRSRPAEVDEPTPPDPVPDESEKKSKRPKKKPKADETHIVPPPMTLHICGGCDRPITDPSDLVEVVPIPEPRPRHERASSLRSSRPQYLRVIPVDEPCPDHQPRASAEHAPESGSSSNHAETIRSVSQARPSPDHETRSNAEQNPQQSGPSSNKSETQGSVSQPRPCPHHPRRPNSMRLHQSGSSSNHIETIDAISMDRPCPHHNYPHGISMDTSSTNRFDMIQKVPMSRAEHPQQSGLSTNRAETIRSISQARLNEEHPQQSGSANATAANRSNVTQLDSMARPCEPRLPMPSGSRAPRPSETRSNVPTQTRPLDIPSAYPLYSMSIPVIIDSTSHPPRFMEIGGHRREGPDTIDRAQLPSNQREIWIRQQLEMENRRRSVASSSTGRPTHRHRLALAHYLDPEAIINLIQHHHRRALLNSAIEIQGVPQEVVDRLTTLYTYVAIPPQREGTAQLSCVICLCNFEVNQFVRRLPCLHIFHKACVDTWLRTNKRCPICRSKIDNSPDEADAPHPHHLVFPNSQ